MALSATEHHSVSGFSLASPFLAFGRAIMRIAENHPRAKQIEALNNTSDEELAARGITREDAFRHIFRDRLFL